MSLNKIERKKKGFIPLRPKSKIELIDDFNLTRKLEKKKIKRKKEKIKELNQQNIDRGKLRPESKEYDKNDLFFKIEKIGQDLLQKTNLFVRKNDQDMYTFHLMNQKSKSKRKDNYIVKNKEALHHYLRDVDKIVEEQYPDIIYLNIPKTIENHKDLNRNDLYSLFIQFKTLLKLSIAINKTSEMVGNGIDWKTFHKGVPEMCIEDKSLAQNIFSVINITKDGFLTWDQFIQGMLTIKSEEIADKIDMFFKVGLLFVINIL